MPTARKTKTRSDFPGKTTPKKDKNSFDLINSVPLKQIPIIGHTEWFDSFEYVRALLNLYEFLDLGKKDKVFTKKDSLGDLVLYLEKYVQGDWNDDNFSYNNELSHYGFDEGLGKQVYSLDIPSYEFMTYEFMMDDVVKFKSKALQKAYAKFIVEILRFKHGETEKYNAEIYYPTIYREAENIWDMNEDELEEDDEGFTAIQRKDLVENSKQDLKMFLKIKSLARQKGSIHSFRPNNTKEQEWKDLFIRFFNIVSKGPMDYVVDCDQALNDGSHNISDMFGIYPTDNPHSQLEMMTREYEFSSANMYTMGDHRIMFTEDGILNKKSLEESGRDFVEYMNIILEIEQKCRTLNH